MKQSGKLSGDKFTTNGKTYTIKENSRTRTMELNDVKTTYVHTTKVAYDDAGNRCGVIQSGRTGMSHVLNTSNTTSSNYSFDESNNHNSEKTFENIDFSFLSKEWWKKLSTEEATILRKKYNYNYASCNFILSMWILHCDDAKQNILDHIGN